MVFGRQPAFWIGLIVSAVLAVLSVFVEGGVINQALADQITEGTNATAQVVGILAPLVTGLLIRTQVTPVKEPTLPAGTEVKVEGTDTVTTV